MEKPKYRSKTISVSEVEHIEYRSDADTIKHELGIRKLSMAEFLAMAVPFFMKHRNNPYVKGKK